MAQNRDSSPIYYREIQKNAFLKRIPDEPSGSKLRPLGLKKPPIKPLWTQLCIHNGRTPYLEQYKDAISARAHRPLWRHSLLAARHVTASVNAKGDEYDFLVDTDDGPVRMMAPDWESMQDWVTTLRSKLTELRIVQPTENVYCAPKVPVVPRAAARDPTSPLPPTPHAPPQRVPGIDLTPITRPNQEPSEPTTPEPQQNPTTESIDNSENIDNLENIDNTENIDISNWDSPFTSLPSTSQLHAKKVTKICGQNICLDDSIFKRNSEASDEEFDDNLEETYKQTLVVSDVKDDTSSDHSSNITVIQVSNKESQPSVFNFESSEVTEAIQSNDTFVNIVNTEANNQNEYGTVFENGDYGHLSLTTTVSLTGDVKPNVSLTDVKSNVNLTEARTNVNLADTRTNINLAAVKPNVNEDLYEKLCLASTNVNISPFTARRLLNQEKSRKSSLPNLESENSSTLYEYVFLSDNNNENLRTRVNSNNSTTRVNNMPAIPPNMPKISSNMPVISSNMPNSSLNMTTISTTTTSNLTSTSNVTAISANMPATSSNMPAVSSNSTPVPINMTTISNIASISTNMHQNSSNIHQNTSNTHQNSSNTHQNSSNIQQKSSNIQQNSSNIHQNTSNMHQNPSNVHINAVSISNSNTSAIRANIDRSNSQNAYDSSQRRRNQYENAPTNGRIEKETPKPMWKRGLTELSLLTRLRGIGQQKRQDSPTRNASDNERSGLQPCNNKVVHRSRPEARHDARRRSSSLSNGNGVITPQTSLQPLRARQAALLRSEQRRGTALVASIRVNEPPVFTDYNKQVWVCKWVGRGCGTGRPGDRVVAVGGVAVKDAAHLANILHKSNRPTMDILFHRVPLAKIYVINKKDQESLGIKLDNECNITQVEAESPAAKAGVPPPGKWAITEVNNRHINLIKGGEEEMSRLSYHGTEASILIQPSPLVKKLRAAIKGNKSILGLR